MLPAPLWNQAWVRQLTGPAMHTPNRQRGSAFSWATKGSATNGYVHILGYLGVLFQVLEHLFLFTWVKTGALNRWIGAVLAVTSEGAEPTIINCGSWPKEHGSRIQAAKMNILRRLPGISLRDRARSGVRTDQHQEEPDGVTVFVSSLGRLKQSHDFCCSVLVTCAMTIRFIFYLIAMKQLGHLALNRTQVEAYCLSKTKAASRLAWERLKVALEVLDEMPR